MSTPKKKPGGAKKSKPSGGNKAKKSVKKK